MIDLDELERTAKAVVDWYDRWASAAVAKSDDRPDDEEERRVNTDFANALGEPAQAVLELIAEARRVREMFDVTRHRVLRSMGEQDMGKSWSWIESELIEMKLKAR